MEWKIGEIRQVNGEWYQCVEGNSCKNCAFDGRKCYLYYDGTDDQIGECCYDRRKDNKDVIFKKLEKVGEQFLYKGKQMQSYIRATDELICNWNNNLLLLEHGDSDIIDIEIKQNKEDMEEKKFNLKPFNLEAAEAGNPVCTRDGRKVRIICFDRDWDTNIVALVAGPLGEEVHYYWSNGKVDYDEQNDDDLMMLPEKKEGWVNVYKGGVLDTKTYPTKKEAFNAARSVDYVDTVKVCWEE